MKKLNKPFEVQKTRIKVSKDWQVYREKKQIILNRKLNSSTKQKYIKELKEKTIHIIQNEWNNYRIKVYNVDNKEFKKISEYKIKTGFEENLKAKSYSQEKTDKQILKLSKKKGLRYLVVIFEFFNTSTGITQYVSESFTPLAVENIFNNGVRGSIYKGKDDKGKPLVEGIDSESLIFSIFELMILKFSLVNDIYKEDFELKRVDYKLIYNENIKKGTKTKKYRHTKK